jgi:hypothetical protein
MREDIKFTIETAKQANQLEIYRFHIMCITAWTHIAPRTDKDGPNEPGVEGEVIPAEIGFVELSLRDGLTNRYYQMVDPRPIPLGYRGDMMARSEKTHQIWIDNPCLSKDYTAILETVHKSVTARTRGANITSDDFAEEYYAGQRSNALEEFSKHIKDDYLIPKGLLSSKKFKALPIYVMPSQKQVIHNSMEWLREKSELEYSFCYYDLPDLLVNLVIRAPNSPLDIAKFTPSIARASLEKDVFLYVKGVNCPFHVKRENPHCAGGAASRLGYIVCDFGYIHYDIKILDGYHLPTGVIYRKNSEQQRAVTMEKSIVSSQNDAAANSSWDNDYTADQSTINDEKIAHNSTVFSQSSQQNPVLELLEDAQKAGLDMADRARHALTTDVQEVTEHLLAPLFSRSTITQGLNNKDMASTSQNDTQYQSFVTSARLNSTFKSDFGSKEKSLPKTVANEPQETVRFRPLHELLSNPAYLVRPPLCHKLLDNYAPIATSSKKSTGIDKKDPPPSKSAYDKHKYK